MKTQTINSDERRCCRCGSLNTHIRLKTNERVCRSCGHIEKLQKKK